MIVIDDTISIQYDYMGLFEGGGEWSHPVVSTPSYEIIYVVKGMVYIEEDGKEYALGKGSMIVLSPFVRHGGYRKSGSEVSFYWLHFFCDGFERLRLKKTYAFSDEHGMSLFFRRLAHLSAASERNSLIEAKLAVFLLELESEARPQNKLCTEIAEWIRLHADRCVSVAEAAAEFGYNPDYICRLFKRNNFVTLKEYIDMQRIVAIKNYLLTTMYTVAQISDLCGFADSNYCIKFFKKHEKTTPTKFRKMYCAVHKNIK